MKMREALPRLALTLHEMVTYWLEQIKSDQLRNMVFMGGGVVYV